MISVGIDVSKEKSTVCILKPSGEIVRKPFQSGECIGINTYIRFNDAWFKNNAARLE